MHIERYMHETIINYVKTERARGVSDDAIRAELLKSGWKAEDIAPAPNQRASYFPTFTSVFEFALFRTNPAPLGWHFLCAGFLLFIITSSLLFLINNENSVFLN